MNKRLSLPTPYFQGGHSERLNLRNMLVKMVYNAAWWIIKRIDEDEKEPGFFLKLHGRIFFATSIESKAPVDAPTKATLTMTEYRPRDIVNPKSYTDKQKEALSK